MKGRDLIFLFAGLAVGLLVMLAFFRESPRRAATQLPIPSQVQSTASELAIAQRTSERSMQSARGERPDNIPDGTKDARWIDGLQGITPDDRKARAYRAVSRVTLARIQRHLIAAPVSSENLGNLMDLLVYKMNFKYEFGRKSKMVGLPTEGEEFERRRSFEEGKLDDEITALVGNAYFDDMMKNFRRIEDRLYSLELIGGALSQGEPLTLAQRGKLNEIVTRLGPDSEALLDPEDGLTMYDRQVIKEIEGVLSPDQLRIFMEVQADRNLFRREKRLNSNGGNK